MHTTNGGAELLQWTGKKMTGQCRRLHSRRIWFFFFFCFVSFETTAMSPCEKFHRPPDAGAGLSWFSHHHAKGGGFFFFIPPLIKDVRRCYSRSNWWEVICGGGGTMIIIQQKENPRTNGRKEREMRNQQQHVECITAGTFLSFLYFFFFVSVCT